MPILGWLGGGLPGVRPERGLAGSEAALLGTDVYRASSAGMGKPRICAAKDCSGGWIPTWKKRRRPVFEDEWACSGRCLRGLVMSVVQREAGEALRDESGSASHRHRVPLGLVLLAQGWITHPQLRTALAAQRSSGCGRIGEWLAESCGLPEERVARGLGVQWGCPVLAVEGFHPAAMARVMPKRFVVEFGLVPLRVAGSSLLYVAFANGPDATASLALEQMSALKVESGLLPGAQFEAVRKSVLEEDGVPVLVSTVKDADELTQQIAKALEEQQPLASRLVRVRGYYWLRLWLESGALTGVGTLPDSIEDVRDYIFAVGSKA